MRKTSGGTSLQRKVLASVLALSVLGVCNIASAAVDEYLVANGAVKTYTENDEETNSGTPAKIVGGWNWTSTNISEGGFDKSSSTTAVTVNSGKFDEVIGGNHIKQPGEGKFELSIGNTTVVLNGGSAEYVTGGSKANNSDNTTLHNGNTSVAVNGGEFNTIIGGNYIKSTGKTGAGTPAKITSAVGTTEVIISGGSVTFPDDPEVIHGNVYGGSVAHNYDKDKKEDKPDLKVTDENTKVTITDGTIAVNVYAGGAAIGTDSQAEVTDTAAVSMSGGEIKGDLVLGGYADEGTNATATVNKSTLTYDGGTIGGNIISNAKTSDVTLNSDSFANAFVAEKDSTMNITNTVDLTQGNDLRANGGFINFTNNGMSVKLGQITADNKGSITLGGKDAVYEVKESGINEANYALVQATSGSTIIFEGKSTNIVAEGAVNGKSFAVVAGKPDTNDDAQYKGTIKFNADTTNISIKDNGNGLWSYGVDAKAGSTVEFNGKDVTIATYKKDYTAQNVTVRTGSTIDFNNSGTTNIITESEYGVTGVCFASNTSDGVINFNKGNVNIISTLTSDNKLADTNAIGIQASDNYNGRLNVSSGVENFTIKVTGQGKYDGTDGNYDGTAAIKVKGQAVMTIDAQNANFVVNADGASDATHRQAYGLWTKEGGIIEIGANTTTNISVSNNGGDETDDETIGVMAGKDTLINDPDNKGTKGTINILGDTTITAVGTGTVYSLKAATADSSITVGSAGKTVSLTGDVLADNGKITLQGSDNTVNGVITSTNGGEVNLNGEAATYNLQHMEADGGTINVGEGTTIVVDSANVTDANYLVTVKDNGSLEVGDNAKIKIANAKKNTEYNIVDGGKDGYWDLQDISTDNFMLECVQDKESGNYRLITQVADAKEVFDGAVLIPDVLTQTLLNGDEGDAAVDFFNSAVSGLGLTNEAAAKNVNNAATMSELAGVSHATYSASNILTDAVADHMSLAKNLDHDTDIWAHYVHNKENIDGLATGNSGARYDAQYNGIVVGADLYKHGKGTIGAALTYIDGKITGNTRNDAEYYGLSIYGGIENEDSAVIGDISYLHGKNDITQNNSGYTLTGEPKSDALSVGVRAEQSFKAGAGKVVPYAGLRYMHLGTGNYANSIGLQYDADDANLFLLPVGVKYSAEHKTAGWTLRPIVEVGYVWAMGDRDGQQTVSLNGASNGFGYDVTDSGSYIGRFVLEAEKANVTYGLGYEYQKGDSVKANKWMVNLNWAF